MRLVCNQEKARSAGSLFFIGLIVLVVFFAMDQAKNPSYGYFCVGIIVVILGGILMMRGRQPATGRKHALPDAAALARAAKSKEG